MCVHAVQIATGNYLIIQSKVYLYSRELKLLNALKTDVCQFSLRSCYDQFLSASHFVVACEFFDKRHYQCIHSPEI